MEYGSPLTNTEELRFFGGGDGGFGDFVGGFDLDPVIREERLVERVLRIEFVFKVRTKMHGNVCGLNAKRSGVSETNALEEERLFPRRKMESIGHVGRGSDAFESEDTRARLGTANAHFFAERENLAKIFFELGARDESALTALTVGDAKMAEGLEGLASGHPADTHALRKFLFGRDGLADLEGAGADLFQEGLLDLVVEGENALSVEDDAVHEELQLSRRLDKYSDSGAMSSEIWR